MDKTTKILLDYTSGKTPLEETNHALEDAGSDIRLNPAKNLFTPEELLATHTGETPEEAEGYPQYQKDGLEALAEAGILDSPETWAGRFGRDMTVGEAVGIMGKLLAWMRTAGENPAG